MSDISLSKALRILALKSVLDPDVDYYYRKIFRWYSKEFHTPLHIVDDLPLEDVLQAYYESRYEDVNNDDDSTKLMDELQELTETEKERLRREMEGDSKKVADDDYLSKVIKEEMEKKLKHEPSKGLDLNEKEGSRPLITREAPKELPDIRLNFNDLEDEEFEKVEEWDMLGIPKKSK